MTIKTRNIADAAVTAVKLAANAVSAAKLSTTMATGFINLHLAEARAIVTNDVGVIAVGAANTVGSGGLLGQDGTGASGVALRRVNAATDKATRIEWQNASVIPVQWSVVLPPDFDNTANLVIKFLAAMKAASVNTPVLTASYFGNAAVAYVADTDRGGNTAALSTTPTVVSVTIALANLLAYPSVASISVLPGAHATALNDVHLYGAWIEYTRK